MDIEGHMRAAEENDRQIEYWNGQITKERQESALRIQNYEAEIARQESDKKDHLETAATLRKDAEKREENIEDAAKAAVLKKLI